MSKKQCLWFHYWYYGVFRSPVWGRYERHCLECPRTEKRVRGKWVEFDEVQEMDEIKTAQAKHFDGQVC